MKTIEKIFILGVFFVGLMVIAPVAQAAVLFDDDLESGINTTDSGAANYWRGYSAGSSVPTTSTAQSHSATHSAIETDVNGNGILADTSWTGDQRSHESWIYRESAAAEVVMRANYTWGHMGSGWKPWAGVSVDSRANTRASPQNFHYQSNNGSGDVFTDTGITFAGGTWYHIGVEMRPDDPGSLYDLYIATHAGDFLPGDLVASNIPYGKGLTGIYYNDLYFDGYDYNNAGNGVLYTDDVLIYDGAMNLIPEPASMIVLGLGGLGLLIGRRRKA